MKIAVVGSGAMGSLFGAMLAESGSKVWLFDIWDEHINAINKNGLIIKRQDTVHYICRYQLELELVQELFPV